MALPKHYFKDEVFGMYSDAQWIGGQIDLLPIAMQSQIAKKYSDIYLKLSHEDPSGCQRRANTWLRLTVKKYKIVRTNDGELF